jgi:AraC-like DNA-binding protein
MKTRYFKHKIENLLHISRIVTVHYFDLEKDYRSPGESHDFWEMIYVERGSLIAVVEGKEIRLAEGEALFHKPNEFHIHASSGGDRASVFIISFECKSEAIRILAGKHITPKRELARYIYAIIDEARETFDLRHSAPEIKHMPLSEKPALGGMQFIKNLVELLIIGTIRQVDGEEGSPSFVVREDFGEIMVNSVIEHLKENVMGRVSIDEICHRTNYARSYVFRQFKAVTGKSIMAYFTELKIKEAKRLLRHTEMTVTEIASALSFDTPNYFTKTFKRISGTTPMAYRRTKKAAF